VKLIYQLLFWFYRVWSSLWHEVHRRLTPAGRCVAGAVLVGGAVGTDMVNNVVFQEFSLLLALLLCALAGVGIFRAGFSGGRRLPRFATVGQRLRYRVRVKNLTSQTQTGLWLLEEFADPRPPFEEWLAYQLAESRRLRTFRLGKPMRKNPFRLVNQPAAIPVPPLPPHGEGEVNVDLLPLRRGVLRFQGLALARTDPLGLFRALSRVNAPQTLVILPRRYPVPSLPLPGVMKYQPGGVALAANVGRSEEFVSLRDYRRGDPQRHIHWRSWAKAGKPIVREFEDELFVRHALILDTFTDDPYSEFLEEAVSVAASFACTLLTQESLLDLLFVGAQSYCFTAGRGVGTTDRMLEILASVRACRDRPFTALETLVLNHAASLSGGLAVFLKWDDERKNFVKRLRGLGVPTLVWVIVESGRAELDAGPLRDQPENFRVLEIGKIEEQLAQQQ